MTIKEKNAMNTITWLHLSDFHFRTGASPKGNVDDFNREVFLNRLLDDLKTYPIENGLTLDFIVVTGDIAFSGQDDEYKHASSYFEKVRKIFKLPKNRLFIIPGNHDVDRTLINPHITIDLSSRDQVNSVLMNEKTKAIQFDRLRGYQSFMNAYMKSTLPFDFNENYFWTKTLTFADARLGLIGLNSAWNCCGDTDRNQLVIGEKQSPGRTE